MLRFIIRRRWKDKTAVEEIATWPSWKIKAAKAAFMEPKNE